MGMTHLGKAPDTNACMWIWVLLWIHRIGFHGQIRKFVSQIMDLQQMVKSRRYHSLVKYMSRVWNQKQIYQFLWIWPLWDGGAAPPAHFAHPLKYIGYVTFEQSGIWAMPCADKIRCGLATRLKWNKKRGERKKEYISFCPPPPPIYISLSRCGCFAGSVRRL